MTDLSGFDAAYPPGSAPPDQVVFGYLGGDTPHVWTPEEWAAQPARYRVGIWTRSNPVDAAQGTREGKAALAAWRALGAPAGTLIVLDYETAVNAAYLTAFDAEAVAGGCAVAVYGSTSTVFKNPRPSGGYFPADITGTPHLYPGALLTQYEFESGWDDDTIAPSETSSLWDTRPAPIPAPPAPQPVPVPEEDTMRQQLVYDAAHRQQHFVYLAGGQVWHRVYDEATSHMSSPIRLLGPAINPDAGVSATLMKQGAELHVFAEFADVTHGTGAHFWLPLPADATKAEVWGAGVI